MLRTSVLIVLILGSAMPQARAESCGPSRGTTGRFDLFLYSLSWSPGFCASPAGKSNPEQCAGSQRFGFILHGLWPQYEAGSWPQCCPAPPYRSMAADESLAGLMPGKGLRRHQWEKHGACVTSDQDAYFRLVERTAKRYGTGPDMKQGERVKVSEVKARWQGVPPRALMVRCRGDALSEIRLCLDRDLSPQDCPASIRQQDNCPGTVTIP